jgi:hypothetical protein
MYSLPYAVNFIASGYSAHKYYSTAVRDDEDAPLNQREPSYLLIVEMLLRYHWGSVVGGSLLLGFFYFVDLLLDFIFVTFSLCRPKALRSMRTPCRDSQSVLNVIMRRKTGMLTTQLDFST